MTMSTQSIRFRVALGKLRSGFPFSTGPTAAHEVPWPLGVAEVRNGLLELRPVFFLRPLLRPTALKPAEIERIELLDSSPGYQMCGMRILLVGRRGYCLWAFDRSAQLLLDWLRSSGVPVQKATLGKALTDLTVQD